MKTNWNSVELSKNPVKPSAGDENQLKPGQTKSKPIETQ